MKRGVLRCVYTVKGRNLNFLPEYLHLKNVSVYGFILKGEDSCKLTIDYVDRRKFFAISKNMCYNIRKVSFRGLLSPIYTIVKYLGVSIGVLLFTLNSFYLNGYIYRIDLTGSGSCYKSEIIALAKEYGVYKGARYNKADISSLKLKLLSYKERLSFVSIDKRGNVVVINTELANSELNPLDKNTQDLVCDVDGIVESVNVLRGTALVNVGDRVSKGSILIGAYAVGKEDKTYPTYVVGRVTVIEEKIKFFKSNKFDENTLQTFLGVAKFLEDKEVVSHEIKTDKKGVYVILKVKHVFQ